MICILEAFLNMMKTNRLIAMILILTLMCGMIVTAGADVVTLGIYFCGKRTAADGSETIVRLEGQFRVTQNGETVGIINAGQDTLTLNGTGRIRIEPLAESILPEWDLSDAAREITPEAGGTMTVSIVVRPTKADASSPTDAPKAAEKTGTKATAKPIATPKPDSSSGSVKSNETDPPTKKPAANPAATPVVAVVTPTLPPFDASVLAPTPQPDWTTLKAGNSGVKVLAFIDQNSNGLPGETESTVSGVTVCLYTEKDKAVAAVKTGTDGIASFKNLPKGKYKIKAILPNGVSFYKKSSEQGDYASLFGSSIDGEAMSGTFTVGDKQTAKVGIGLARCLHVSGSCWFEKDNDGVMKDGEPRLGGVRIELNGVKNGLHYETISAADGSWMIDRVSPAMYKLTVYAPDGMMFARNPKYSGNRSIITKEGSGSGSRNLDLNDKQSKEKLYVGFTWAGVIQGRVFQDANYNGKYDEGEPPMAGVKITAIKQAKDEEVAVTRSGKDGTYKLTGLRGGTYKLRAVLPQDGSDFTKTVSDPLGNHFASRPGRRENFWPDFVLADAQTIEMNVGAIYPATVTGTVYLDSDFSGTLSGKEKTVSGYLVKLLDKKGNTVAWDKTSVKGKFEITDVPPGQYSLSVTALDGYAFTREGEGNVILNRTNGEGYSKNFSLGLGEKKTNMHIGMIKPGTVTGSVFADRNDNGVRDSGENGLKGVVVRLMGEDGEAFRAEIGDDGNYLFDAVMPGTYYLEYTLPENAVFARTKKKGNTISGEGTGRSKEFKMKSGGSVEGPVCGALTLGRIAGTAYFDHDGNGTPDDTEETASGVTVKLTPSRKELEEITVTTSGNGNFVMENLRPDNYTLSVVCPDGYVVSRTDNLKLPLTAGKNDQSVALPLAMGAVWRGQRLGIVMPASVSGQLWLDENNDGLFDSAEATPSGYEITVTDNRNGKVFDTLKTDEEGRFSTSGMIPGSFTLSFPLDKDTIAPKDGNSDFKEENGKLVLRDIELREHEDREGLLLGIVEYTNISGSVWIDRGGDGVENLAGAQISLTDGNGNVLSTQKTDGTGAYRFTKLMPGTYQLEAMMPEGCVIIEPGDSRLNKDRVSVMTQTVNRSGSSDLINLKMGKDRKKMNIGCVLPGQLGDFCWLDLDGDGLQGMDEPGIANVQIELLRDGVVVAETVTDQYGFYRFNDLYPAAYTLRVYAPSEVKPTKRRTDIPMIASVMEEGDGDVFESVEIEVVSSKANYNADIGFVCRQKGVLPAGAGTGKTQNWNVGE